MNYIQAFFMSLGMFTSIPCPYRPWNEKARHLMLVCLPLVGLVIGLLWYGIYLLMEWLNIPLQLQAAVLALYPFLVTGFIHLDGFMDTADAILSRRPLEEKLRILKDPHTGAFAVISVGILFVFSFAAMSAIVEQINFKQSLGMMQGNPMLSLILIPVISRCGSALAILAGKPLSHSQYSEKEEMKKPSAKIAVISLMGLGALALALALGGGMLPLEPTYGVFIVLLGAALAYVTALSGVVRQLKGVSGDLAGCSLTIAEAFAILVLAVLS